MLVLPAAMGNMFAESGLNSRNLQNSYEKKLGYTDASYTKAVVNGVIVILLLIKPATAFANGLTRQGRRRCWRLLRLAVPPSVMQKCSLSSS